jgi:hypothetical protein
MEHRKQNEKSHVPELPGKSFTKTKGELRGESMRVVTIPREWRIQTEQDIVKIHQTRKPLYCEICGAKIEEDMRFKTIVEHNDGGIKDQESKPICCDCFNKLRVGFKNVAKQLSRYDEFQRSDGTMKVKNK